jgi:hypothetical protein
VFFRYSRYMQGKRTKVGQFSISTTTTTTTTTTKNTTKNTTTATNNNNYHAFRLLGTVASLVLRIVF